MANNYLSPNKHEVALRGYFMRHKTGGDVGFSWKQDDPIFSEDWERIPAVPEAAETGDAIYQVRSARVHTGWIDVNKTQYDEMVKAEDLEGRVVRLVPG
jgi:hypothetical protein